MLVLKRGKFNYIYYSQFNENDNNRYNLLRMVKFHMFPRHFGLQTTIHKFHWKFFCPSSRLTRTIFSHFSHKQKKREREPSPLHCIVRYYVQHNASNNVCFNFHHISMHSQERGCTSPPPPLPRGSPLQSAASLHYQKR